MANNGAAPAEAAAAATTPLPQMQENVPENARAAFVAAAQRHQAGESDAAIKLYMRAIELYPAFADAYNNRGAAFRGKGELDRAIADYKAALRVDPRDATAAENLAAVQAERKRAKK